MNGSSTSAVGAACRPAPEVDSSAFLKVFNFYIVLTISIVGMIANAFIIAVFSKKRRLSSTDFLAGSLAFYDMLVVVAKSMYAHRYAYPYLFGAPAADAAAANSDLAASRVALVALCVDRVVHLCNTYTIVLLSLDRYVRVCHSTRAKRWCTHDVARKMETVLLAFALLYTAPAVYMFAEVLAADPDSVRLCGGFFQFADGFLGRNEAFGYGYDFVMYMVVLYLIPLTTLCFSNVNLIKTVVERQRFAKRVGRSTPQNSGKSSDGLTEMSNVGNRVIATLILVTAIFFLSQLPALADQIHSFPYFKEGSALHIVSYDFVLVNCSVNCAVYTLSSRTFRRRLRALLGLVPSSDLTSGQARYTCCQETSKYAPEATSAVQKGPSSLTPV